MPRKPAPESQKKVGIGARVDPTLLEQFQRIVRDDRRTVSSVVEYLIREYVDRHEADKRKR